MLGTDTAVEIQTHTTAKRPTERNSVGDTSPFVHLYEIVLRRASTWPTAIAIGGQEGLTWKTLNGRQLLELVDLLAQELAGEGVAAGDRVVTWLPNHWRTSVYLFALWKLGAVVVPFDREMNPGAAARIIQSVSPRCVLVGYAERPQWLRDAPLVEWWGPGSRISDSPVPDTWAVPDETLATISFTSGTTGEPKGCMITHANLCSQLTAARDRIPLGPECRLASILPLSHLFELTAGLLYPLAAGAEIHYIPTRRAPDILRVLDEQRVTHMMAVPQILAGIGQAIEAQLRGRLPGPLYTTLRLAAEHAPLRIRRCLFWQVHRRLGGHLRLLAAGGAALSPDVHRLWEQFGIRVIQGYGASECSPIIACGAADGSTPIGTVGTPLHGVEVRLGTDGELFVRGPNVMRGYWADERRTAAAIDAQGWYHTGDLATLDAGGNIQLIGRARDLIVLPSGMNVWPEDVETLLRGHPLVQDAAVVAVSKEGGGTSLHAYLIPSGSTTTDQLRGILADCNSRLAQHQRLASASWWPEADFPRTAMLKVRRHLLPRPLDLAAVHVQASHAADDPVSQVVAGAAHVPTVAIDQTLGELGLDSLGLVDLALALEEKTGKAVSDGDLRMEMTVKQVHELVESAPAVGARATHAREGETIDPDVPLWPYTLGRPLRVFGILVDLIYALAVNRTLVLGQDNLVDLPSPVIFAGTHHGFGDMPLVRRALARTTGRRRGWRLVTAIAAGGFNSGGPKFGHGMGLYPWYGILALGLFPLRQHAERGESLRRLVQVASAGNDVLIFPQGTHARPADERAGNATVAFHSGVAHLARGLAADVVPFGVAGTERVMPPDPSRFGGPLIAGIPVAVTRGPLAIVFGPRQTITPDESAEVFATRLQDVCFGLTRQAERALEAGGTPR